MTVEQAKNSGALGVFDNRYGEKVTVYTIEGVSKEIWQRLRFVQGTGNPACSV